MLFQIFYFEVLINSHAILRNTTERFHVPFAQFPPMGTSCQTTVQYHIQDSIDSQDTQHFYHHRDISCCPFIVSPTHLQPSPLP